MSGPNRWGGVVVAFALALAACGEGSGTKPGPTCDVRFVSPSGQCDAGAIEGSLRYPNRDENAGFRVELDGEGRAATTGHDGRFRFDGVPPGRHTLGITTPGGTLETVSVDVAPLRKTDVGTVVFEEDRPSRVSGKVLLEGAADHGGTQVTVVGGSAVAITRADGTFLFPALQPGSRTLRAEHPGYAAAEQVVALTGESERRLPDWSLAPLPMGGTIAGRVAVAGTGEAVADATVIVVGAGDSVRTGEDGAFSLRGVPEGTWEVRVGKPGFAPATVEDVEVGEGRTTEIFVRLSPSASVGFVSGVARRLGETTHAGVQVVLTDGEASFAATTQEDGRWNVEGVPVGIYDLRASWDGLETSEVRGVAIGPGPNVAPDLLLGPAIPIADRAPAWSRVLPGTRRAVLQFDDGLARFDRETGALVPLANGFFWPVSTDAAERFLTVAGSDGQLLRLSVEDGSLRPVALPSLPVGVWSWGAMALVETMDREFFLVHAEATAGERIDPGCPVRSVELDEGEARPGEGAVVLRAYTECGWSAYALADLDSNFVGFFGTTLFPTEVKHRAVSLRPTAGFSARRPGEAWWVDAEAHRATRLSGSITQLFADAAEGIFAFVAPIDTPGGIERPLVQADLDTGTTTTLLGHAADYAPVGPRIVLAWPDDRSEPLRWIALDGGGQGTLCRNTAGVRWDMQTGMIACFGDDGRLLVFDERTRTVQEWGTDVTSIHSVEGRLVRWRSMNGENLRHADGERITVPLLGGDFIRAALAPSYWLVYGRDTGARIVAPATGAWLQVTPPGEAPPVGCAVSPSMESAVCVEGCLGEGCYVVRDLVEGTSAILGESSGVELAYVSWAADESSVTFIGGGPFFAARSGGSWAGSRCPLGTARTYASFTAPGARASLWELSDGTYEICTETGAVVAAGRVPDAFRAILIPGTSSYALRDGVANLSDGSFTEFYGEMRNVHSLAGGLVGVTPWDEVAELGADGAFIVGTDFAGIETVGGVPYVATAAPGKAPSLWAVRDGAITRIVDGMESWIRWAGRVLIFGAPDSFGARRLSILDPATDEVEPVAEKMDAAESWWLYDGGLAYRSASGSGLWLLSPSGSLTRLGDVDEIVRGNDEDSLIYRRDGVLWSLTPTSLQAVLRADGASVSDWAADSVLFAQDHPRAAYWYEVRR